MATKKKEKKMSKWRCSISHILAETFKRRRRQKRSHWKLCTRTGANLKHPKRFQMLCKFAHLP